MSASGSTTNWSPKWTFRICVTGSDLHQWVLSQYEPADSCSFSITALQLLRWQNSVLLTETYSRNAQKTAKVPDCHVCLIMSCLLCSWCKGITRRWKHCWESPNKWLLPAWRGWGPYQIGGMSLESRRSACFTTNTSSVMSGSSGMKLRDRTNCQNAVRFACHIPARVWSCVPTFPDDMLDRLTVR